MVADLKNKPIIFALALSLLASCSSDIATAYRSLDETVENIQDYHLAFERETDSLRRASASAVILFEKFRFYQADSAEVYLSKALDETQGADNNLKFSEVEFYASLRKYDKARSILNGIDRESLSPEELASFYKADLYLDGTMAVDEFIPEDVREKIMAERYEKRYHYINCAGIDPFEKVRRTGMQLYESGNAKEAVKILKELVDRSEDPLEKANSMYSLASAYKYLGDRTQREYWLARSASISLRIPVRNYLSLHELSNMLFEDNDLKRASRYCQVAMNDAIESKFNSKVINSSVSQLEIVKAVERQTKRESMFSILIIVVLVIMLMIVGLLLKKRSLQKKKIGEINKELSDANKIKDGYVFRYVVLSANYLKKVDEYRHEMRLALKNGGIDALKGMLRNTTDREMDYKSFYKIFDETFLGLFPDFVEKVNELLKPEARFSLKADKELSTGLRILAAIKLGFSDSGKIAEFLNCAPSSVYTHRSKIKRDALCDASIFEDMISKL